MEISAQQGKIGERFVEVAEMQGRDVVVIEVVAEYLRCQHFDRVRKIKGEEGGGY